MGDSDSDSDTLDLVVSTPEKENPNRTILGKMNVSLLKKNTDGLNSLIKQSSISSQKTVLPQLQDESLDYGETNGHAGNNCNIDSSVSEGSQNDETIRPIVDEIFNKKTPKSVESQDLTCTSMSNAKTSVSEMSLKHNYIKEDTIQPQTSTKSDKYRNSKATIDSSDCDEFVIETSPPKSESCTHKSYHLGHDSKNDSSLVASNIRRKRHGRNIIVSDSEDSEKEDRSPNKTSEKETFDSSRYRDKDLITVSSDSEESGRSEDEASISDSSDFETAVDMSGIKIGAPVESTSVKENSFHSKVTERTGSELPKVVEVDNVSSENKPQPKDKETSMNRTSMDDSSIQIISDTPNNGKVKQVASQSTVSTKAENSRVSFSPTLFSTPNKQVPIKRDPVEDLQQTLQLVAITEEKSLLHPLSSVQDDNKKKQAAFAENIKPSAPQSNVQDMVNKKKEMKNEMLALSKEIDRFKGILRTVNLATLADRGTRIHMAMNEKELKLKKLREQWVIHNMDSVPDVMESSWKPNPPVIPQKKPAETATGGSSGAVPKKTEFLGAMPSTAGMGKQAFETHMAEKAMTVDALKHLHSSLKECPGENVTAEDPKALKSSVVLMEHQKRALAWLMWRESYKPYGGILADDMGLGKTLTMIALVLKAKEERENNEADKEEDSDEEDGSWYSKKRKYEKGGTLVVCPASLINQWEGEVKRRVRRGVLDVEVYHGQSRETKPRRLAKRDIVITTYNIVRTEGGVSGKAGNAADPSKQGCLFGVKWERVILDEGHTIRNHKSQTSVAACALKARHRWALTGTPMHNKELDLYSLLKFLRCSPFDEYVVWRKWIDNKSAGGMQRLNTVMNSLMLRRTKEQLQNAGALSCLPTKEICEIVVKLDKEEFEVYQTVLNFSRTLFAQFLAQKVEKEQLLEVKYGQSNQPTYMQKGRADFPYEMTPELKALHQKMNNIGDIKSFHILVLLLRLRQICCHPALIESMLDEDVCKGDGIEDEAGVDIDLLSQMQNMGLEDKNAAESVDADGEVKKKVLVSSNPVFKKDRVSSKMRLLFQELQDKVISRGDNAVIVSQFTSMLELIRRHLKSYGIKCMVLTGAVPVKDRMALVEDFNTPSEGSKVMLLSLTAGGVGLNLIGGNHLLLMDPHWNPQLEAQAFDRIYRVGQKKAVHIYKFLSDETIEQQIKMLQIKKMSLATSVLTGSKHHQASKLSMEDLKTLFQLK